MLKTLKIAGILGGAWIAIAAATASTVVAVLKKADDRELAHQAVRQHLADIAA